MTELDHPHAHGSAGSPADDHDDDHHAHAEVLPEPSSPLWLPALGAALFLVAAVLWMLSAGSSSSTETAPEPAAAESDDHAGHGH
jgi:hypothetical protein